MITLARLCALALALQVVCLSSCKPSGVEPSRENAGPPASPAARESGALSPAHFEPGNAERGKALVAQFECHRCHAGTGLAAPRLERDCVGCHEQIATGKFNAKPEKLAEWKSHVLAYRDVPSLGALGARLRPEWVRDYLLRPHDLRPNLAPTMPRLALSADQARDIATYLTSSSAARTGGGLGVRADGAQVSHGKQLLSERGCTGCHEISGSGLPRPPHLEAAPRTLSLAPDLRFERERADPESIARWLLEPGRVKPDAVMPNLGLRPEDARDLAAFLSFGELSAPPSPERHERLPLLTRRVGFDEVDEQVFRVTCRHCHTSPDSTDGDGGPGSTGGFGFPPRKIDFSSYRGIQSGALDGHGDGQRVSLFSPTSEGLPRLVAALVARQREIAGAPSDEVRGMPLGLPALSDQQIQLVESWVAQGRPL